MDGLFLPWIFYARHDKIIIMKKYDVMIIGAGASGMAAAHAALARGRSVAAIDMGNAPLRKVAASGGGRCNFTNAAAGRNRYFGENPDFVRGPLARVTSSDILDWARGHNIAWTEKSAGQYFCADGAGAIVDALMSDARGAKIIQNDAVESVDFSGGQFIIHAASGDYGATSVIVATGGVSFPTLGTSDIGYKIAKHFGHKIVPVRPALCAIATGVFTDTLAGISLPVEITVGRDVITDDMLFTHVGIGGPTVYRATVRNSDADWIINLMPNANTFDILSRAKRTDGRKTVATILGQYMPARVAQWIARGDVRNIADIRDTDLRQVALRVQHIVIARDAYKYHGLRSAEVVRGGVATDQISSRTMESKLRSGLFFAGEVIDIAGDLGGFNLHWAWASGTIAGENA
ncbi:MAG TPA: aminoacetone oxidase family FAD-binding enzyme [Alphaproteobacteria bacterium]|nr:aminoacetone oxidase family FAD-binding enzyme [Alphaproteobacteria bacterium]